MMNTTDRDTAIAIGTAVPRVTYHAHARILFFECLEEDGAWVPFSEFSHGYWVTASTDAEAEAKAQTWLTNRLKNLEEVAQYRRPNKKISVKATQFSITKEYAWAY